MQDICCVSITFIIFRSENGSSKQTPLNLCFGNCIWNKTPFNKNITIIRLILLSVVSLFTIFLPEIKWNPTWYWSTSRAATLIYGHQRNSLDYGILLMLSNLSKLQVTFLWWAQVILRKLSHHYIIWFPDHRHQDELIFFWENTSN